DPEKKSFKGKGTALAFTAAFILSFVMFYVADNALGGRDFVTYWVLKVLFAGTAVCVGMGISAVLEEYAIWRLARNTHGQASFYTSVIRANYITLGLVLLVATANMLPKRLNSPHLLVSMRTSSE